jgi:hypothetical protein
MQGETEGNTLATQVEGSGNAKRISRRRLARVSLGTAVGLVAVPLAKPGLTAIFASTPRAQAAARAAGGNGTVVVRWNAATLTALGVAKAAPTVGARALAIVHTCMYDAWAAYHPVALGTLFGNTLRAQPPRSHAHKAEAVSFAAYRALLDLFPSQAATFSALMASLGYDPGNASTDTSTPAGIGNVAARAELDFRHGDGSNQPNGYADYTGYTPVNSPSIISDPNRWQPLLVNGAAQRFVTPHWGLVRSFALTSGLQFRPGPPEQYPSDGYRQQAVDLLTLSAGLTDTQKVIAEYWANANPPAPVAWAQFAQFISQRDEHGLDDDIRLFFALTNAFSDALIAVWDAKRAYDSVRPVTAIRYLFAGAPVMAWGGPFQGTRTIDGGMWRPYLLATPSFPEYVSAHSAVSSASAEVLARFTGSDAFGLSYTQPAGSSGIEPGLTPASDVTLSWATFSQAANEAGLSRRYGGIHFEEGDLRARALGRQVAAVAWDKARSYFNVGDS